MLPKSRQAVVTRHPDPFPDEVIAAIKRHAEEAYPHESVGFVYETGYEPVENVASEPEQFFSVHPDDVLDALQRGALAFVHSHPDGPNFPSAEDQKHQINSGMVWGIVPVRQNIDVPIALDITWWGDKLPVAPLERRSFIFGVFDCYRLYRDWFYQETGIWLKNYAAPDNYTELGMEMFLDNCEDAGLRNLGKVDITDLQRGDMLVGHMLGSVSNHCAVYLGGDDVLHHLPSRPSGKELLVRVWPHVDTVFRYEGPEATPLRRTG